MSFCTSSTLRPFLLIGRKGVFERRASSGSESLSFLICHNASKFVLPSAFSLMKTNWTNIWENHCPRMKTLHFRLTCVPPKRLCLGSLITICSVLRPLGEWGSRNHLPVLYLINSRNFSLSSLETFPTCLFVASMMYFSLGNVAKDRTGLKLIVSQGTGQVHLSPVSL